MSSGSRFDFGVNAAMGLTLQMASTWSPWLPREPRLLVPVHLDVLVVRKEGGTWAATAVREGDSGEPLPPPPFSDLPAPRAKGAHLLWAPPDALARGRKPRDDEEGPIQFPPLPERWLVLRLSPSSRVPGRRTVRGWVLKADEPGSAPVPLEQYADPIEPLDGQSSGPSVTVVGPGQLDWVGYFDNVQNRFAFHDPLTDVAAGPVAYLVCGWYRDPDRDPLSDPDIRTQADFEKLLDNYRWHLPHALYRQAMSRAQKQTDALDAMGLTVTQASKMARRASTSDAIEKTVKLDASESRISAVKGVAVTATPRWWPRHTLCHGALVGIGWPTAALDERGQALLGQGEEVGGPPSSAGVTVGFGNTLTEAMAALIAQRDGRPEHARVLQAFQLGAMNDIDEPDGRAKLDALLHASTFQSLPGGSVTERVWQPPLGEPPVEGVPKDPGHGVFERYYGRDVVGRAGGKQVAQLGKQAKRSTKAVNKAAFVAQRGAARAAQPVGANSFATLKFTGAQLQAESLVKSGRASAAARLLGAGTQRAPYRPGRWVDRERPLPRLFRTLDPVLVVEGIKRAYQHGGDGRFSRDGWLGVRLSGTAVKDYRFAQLGRTLNGEDVLDRGVGNGSVPPECEDLLNELALLDPGSSIPLVRMAMVGKRASTNTQRVLADTVLAQQTGWWAARDPRVDSSAIVSLAPFNGTLPSPVAINLPSRPWNPLHLEWRVEYLASPGALADWTLGELDYNEDVPDLPAPGSVTPLVLEGRSPLAAGAGRTLAGAIRRALSDALAQRDDAGTASPVEHVAAWSSEVARKVGTAISGMVALTGANGAQGQALDAGDRATLSDIAAELEQIDVLASGLDGFNTGLRGGIVGDGEALSDDGQVPAGFVALRAGFMRVLRLRVVDAFGQVLNLAGSNATTPADPARVLRSEPLEVTTRPELLALAPRFTSPARLWLRFTEASGGPLEARDKTDLDDEVSPVCGYLMPNHLDDALLFYAPDGRDLGVVRRNEDNRIAWEDAPGAPSTVGASPAQAVSNASAAGIAQALLNWGVSDAGLLDGEQSSDTALRALMRVIDTTRWTVDPFGHQGEEHLALLVGQPVVVVRAVLRLEVDEPVDPAAVNALALPVRLGALAHWQDGLLGYFVDDDYRRLHCSDAAVAELSRAFGAQRGFLQAVEDVPDHAAQLGSAAAAEPITHPYVDRSGVILMRPGQDVRLTLLIEPHTLVHATCGVLPRKDVGLRKEWTQDALAKLSPTFRFGPVLVDPKKVRMPVAADLHGTWSWDHRKDVTTWENLPVTHATQEALLPQDPPIASEGWLRLRPLDDEGGSTP